MNLIFKMVVVSSQSGLDWKSTLFRDMEADVNQRIILGLARINLGPKMVMILLLRDNKV